MQLVSTTDLRNDLSEYLDQVDSNKTPLLISRFGKPIAKVTPVDKEKDLRGFTKYFGFLKGEKNGVEFEDGIRRSSAEKNYIKNLKNNNE